MEVGLDGGQNTGAARRRGPLAHRGRLEGMEAEPSLALALLLLLLEKTIILIGTGWQQDAT